MLDQFVAGVYFFFLGWFVNLAAGIVLAGFFLRNKKLGKRRELDVKVWLILGVPVVFYLFWRYQVIGGAAVLLRRGFPFLRPEGATFRYFRTRLLPSRSLQALRLPRIVPW